MQNNLTRRAALGSITAVATTGAAGTALAISGHLAPAGTASPPLPAPAAMTQEQIDRRIEELATEIAELLPHHPIQRLGKRGWFMTITERSYCYSAPSVPEPHDPILNALETYREGMDAYWRLPIVRR